MHGRVQGVGFRVAAASRAQARGVAGSVRNTPDGTVEAVLEGEADAVDAVVEWCRAGGPRGARVDAVDVVDEEPEGLRSFDVR